MKERKLREKHLTQYLAYLREEERAPATIRKYERALHRFFAQNTAGIVKETVIRYKEALLQRRAACLSPAPAARWTALISGR